MFTTTAAVVLFVLFTGAFVSVPVTFGTAYNFWRSRADHIGYDRLFGPLYIGAMIVTGPLFAVAMCFCAWQRGSPVGYRYPSRAAWEAMHRRGAAAGVTAPAMHTS